MFLASITFLRKWPTVCTYQAPIDFASRPGDEIIQGHPRMKSPQLVPWAARQRKLSAPALLIYRKPSFFHPYAHK